MPIMVSRLPRITAGVIIDLSGTVHVDEEVIEGSLSAFKKLKDEGLPVKFVTNSTRHSHRMLYERMKGFNFDICKSDIFTSLSCARNYVDENNLRPMLFLEDAALEDFEGVPRDNPNAVVVAAAPSRFTYNNVNEAFRLLLNGGKLIASHKSRYYKTKEGLCIGPGAYVTGLEFATDTKATVIGKPTPKFFEMALKGMGCDLANTVMIGDDVKDDVLGAMKLGMMGVLVQTGKYRQGDENKIDPPPSATCLNLASAVELILKSNMELNGTGISKK